MDLLTRLEEVILIAVLTLGDNAYGVPINRVVSQIIKKPYTMGGLYFALDQLARKEYLIKKAAEPTPRPGGRSRSYYRLTIEGHEALAVVRRHQTSLWQSAAGLIPGETS